MVLAETSWPRMCETLKVVHPDAGSCEMSCAGSELGEPESMVCTANIQPAFSTTSTRRKVHFAEPEQESQESTIPTVPAGRGRRRGSRLDAGRFRSSSGGMVLEVLPLYLDGPVHASS